LSAALPARSSDPGTPSQPTCWRSVDVREIQLLMGHRSLSMSS